MLEINKIYNMDCVEGMKMLPDECIDLTVTSPPYDNLRKYKGFEWSRIFKRNPKTVRDRLKRGWSYKRALTTPVDERWSH